MRTMFERSFATSFGARPIHGFRPFGLGQIKLKQLGQDEGWTPDSEAPWTPPSDFQSTYTYPQTPSSPWTPSPQYTAQGPQQQVPALPTERPANTSDNDWAKILADGFKAVGTGYGVYSQAAIAKMKAQAEILRAKNPAAASILPSSMSTTTTILLVLGGISLLGIGLVVAFK